MARIRWLGAALSGVLIACSPGPHGPGDADVERRDLQARPAAPRHATGAPASSTDPSPLPRTLPPLRSTPHEPLEAESGPLDGSPDSPEGSIPAMDKVSDGSRPLAVSDALAPIPERTVVHRARPGEDLIEISGRYDAAPRGTRRSNRRERSSDGELRPGARVMVRARRLPPPRVRVRVEARAGDTLGEIARQHGLDGRLWARSRRQRPDSPVEAGASIEVWSEPTLSAQMRADDDPLADEVRAGAWSVGAPDDGRLANGVRIPQEAGWTLRFEHRAWGSTYAVRATLRALRAFRSRGGYAGKLRIWSMSRHYGGPLPDHESHQSGRDLDVKLPLLARLDPQLAVRPAWIDALALWRLLEAFVETGATQVIFLDHDVQARVHAAAVGAGVPRERVESILQYPRSHLAAEGEVRHLAGHADHFHVRFDCAPGNVLCTDRR